MKKIILTLLLLSYLMNPVNARRNKFFGWFHITPKIGAGTSVLANKGMFDMDGVSPQAFNGAYSFGAQLGAAFMDKFDLSVEIGQTVTNQLYSVNVDQLNYDKNLKFRSFDYGAVFKVIGGSGYFEIGTMISEVKDIYIKNTVKTSQTLDFNDDRGYFNLKYYNLIAGVGATLVQVDLVEVTLGARCRYGLQPLLSGPEMPLVDNVFNRTLDMDSKSRNISFMLELEIHGFFGFFGKAICGSRAVIFFKRPKTLW